MDRQVKSNSLTIPADQLDLLLRRDAGPVSDEVIAQVPAMTQALALAVAVSGLTDKQVYMSLHIDAGQWARIMHHQSHFPHDRLLQFMDVVGNDIPLRWLAMRRAYELVPMLSQIEAELVAERRRSAELEIKLKHFEEFHGIARR